MTTYTFSSNSPRNTVLTDREGNVAYKISTPFTLKNITTTITRADESNIIAVVHWNIKHKNEVTINGITQRINDVFPKTKALGRSRVYTTPNGERFKWKNVIKLYCVSEPTGLNIATYYKKLFGGLREKKSTLDIAPDALHLSDLLVVTWAIMEKEGED
ncbi:hypothetical protein RSOLAG22IIIB_06798 [Rhizoctonia solani]|uniref:DUF6593 domain-containing protein n=1 Tax=Rhizoctonia solani TaxID=456999 RepID=A0A0K6GH10_9AGAM|nr:unnamed protein product [Rhizoctonia solani]CUA77790.1 hypothetical protein RSOLAG22IIIB_06798 [Rhizoctonia solani]